LKQILLRIFREPLFQFILFGTGIYALYGVYGDPPQEQQDRTIVITEDHVTSFATSFTRRWNRAPSNEELLGLVREYVRETLLYREALAMGLDADDHIIRRRLAQKLEFLTNDLVKINPPDDAVLAQFLAQNVAQFRAPDLVTFSHVFLDPDKRGDATLADAGALLQELQTDAAPTPQTLKRGDRFMMQSYFPEASYHEIQRQMGAGFADAVMKLAPGQWHGPVLSGYGVHLVYVSNYIAADDPLLADVRDQVQEEYLRRQTEEFNAEYLDALAERYNIIIEGPLKNGMNEDKLMPLGGSPNS
jgi:peptidyl-prolyl cis-trans isomerase C